MSDQEGAETVEQQLRSIATDWATAQAIKQGLGKRIAATKRRGASWRRIARMTSIPMTDARRWAAPYLADDETAGAA